MKTLILLFSVLFTTMSFAQVPNYVPANGLVGWWPFNGNANDESGNGNNGTVNGAALTADRNGVANQAYSFDGSSWIDILLNGAASGNNKITLSAWVYRNSLPNSVEYIFCYGAASGNEGIAFGMGEYGSQGIFTTFMGSQFDAISNIPLSINSWHNITSIHQQNGIIEIYLDGNLTFTTNVQTPNIQNILGRIGKSIYDGNDFWNGKIDDIGIWNRALTDCEIQNLYTSTNPSNTTTASACNNYTWNGTTYSTSGVYTGTTTNCVTQSLNLTIIPSSTNTTSETACDSYTWNGTNYTTSGVFTGPTANCVTESLNLTIIPSFTNTTTATECDTYTWNGTTYTSSGVYTGTTANCVTESLNLTIIPSSTNTTTATACDSYSWNGTSYTTSGVYIGTTANCVTESLNLTITPAPIVNQIPNQTICSGTSAFIFFTSSTPGTNFSWSCNTNMNISGYNCNGNGNVLSEVLYNNTSVPQVLVYTIVGTNNGCSSQPIPFVITVYPTPVIYNSCVNSQTICSGEMTAPCNFSSSTPGTNFSWSCNTNMNISGYNCNGNGNVLSEVLYNNTSVPQVLVYTIVGTNNYGCISQPINFFITVLPSSTNTTTAAACDSYTWNGQTYSSSGVYTGATANCVTESLNLTITPSSTNTTSASACGSYVWNGTTYTSSGVYTGTTTNCVTQALNLTITPSSTNTTTAAACNNYAWNGQTYTQSGVYTGTTANCVTQALNLTINTNTSSSISQTALDSYTWPVNNQTYTTTGAYTAVIPNAAGCDSTITLNLTMSFTGINELSASKLSIYPNPTNGDFTITGLELVGTVSYLSLTDMNGKVVKVLDTKATKFSMASIKSGVYFLNVISGNKEEVLKIVKE